MPPLSTYFPAAVMLAVFLLIAVRQVGALRLAIWQVMLGGGVAVLATGFITPEAAVRAINPDVMLFLFGMFVVGEALVESGYLYQVSFHFFERARSVDGLVLLVIFVMGVFSALLMNDTLAIIGTPLVLYFADRHGVSPKLLLLALCFAITTGSVMSPIGNPQNLLIAVGGGVPNPFVTFFKYLAVPTALNLFLTYIILKIFYAREFHKTPLAPMRETVRDEHLARLSLASLVIIAALIVVKTVLVFLNAGVDFKLTYIALAAAAPPLLLSPKRLRILKSIDWHTLIFFAAMFVLMEAVWQSGVMQSVIHGFVGRLASVGLTLAVSVAASQVLSNVPFVALYLPALAHNGAPVKGMMALAAGSTIAGNLFILGAASNVIVIQNAEKRLSTLTFLDFAKTGAAVTAVNLGVYWGFLRLMG
ncbi:MAG: anion transporter [Deltaproteobacteria bacterium]|nr:anion transporter [Deltaproteobacteria bacterium]